MADRIQNTLGSSMTQISSSELHQAELDQLKPSTAGTLPVALAPFQTIEHKNMIGSARGSDDLRLSETASTHPNSWTQAQITRVLKRLNQPSPQLQASHGVFLSKESEMRKILEEYNSCLAQINSRRTWKN